VKGPACFTERVPVEARKRVRSALGAAGIVAAGLGSRRPQCPQFVLLYVGDVLWGSLFYVLAAWVMPRARPALLWGVAVALVELIEVSQLYRAPFIDNVRATALGGLLLGYEFLWSDVLCVAFGASLAALVDAWRRVRALRYAERAHALDHRAHVLGEVDDQDQDLLRGITRGLGLAEETQAQASK
jgi:hypothetical protein